MLRTPTRRALGAALPLLAAGLLAAPGGAGADWLVTRDGARIETAGPWQVRGKLVVFEKASGELVSMRLSELDMEASRRATAAPPEAEPEPPAPAPTPERQAVLVITDADVAHASPVAAGAEGIGEPGDAAAADPDSAGGPATRLQVLSWDEAAAEEGVAVIGRLRNASPEALTAVTVTVSLLDAEGELLATEGSRVASTTLAPGTETTFRAEFPSVWAFFDVQIETDAFALASRDVEDAPPPSVPSAPEG